MLFHYRDDWYEAIVGSDLVDLTFGDNDQLFLSYFLRGDKHIEADVNAYSFDPVPAIRFACRYSRFINSQARVANVFTRSSSIWHKGNI